MTFEQLNIAPCFINSLQERNIAKATDIQLKVIPRLAAGESVFFTSATGTGKTFAYLLPLLGDLIEKNSCKDAETRRAQSEPGRIKPSFIIVAPTLELCTQIKGELDFLLKDTDIRAALLIGSVNLERQIEKLKKIRPDVIVGNPNRLLILARKKIIRLNSLRIVVLDEADRLVSEEMSGDTNELCKLINHNTDKGLLLAACSATMNKKCREKLLTVTGFRSEASGRISFIESQDHEILREKIEHWAIFSEKRRKDQTLRSLLAALKTKKSSSRGAVSGIKALVFTSKGDEAALVLSRLLHHNVAAAGLFGKIGSKPLSGAERREALEAFRKGTVEALVSTDLAARGLDIHGITHIIALDVPSDDEVYIHRCGRTGRTGKHGIMVTIGDETQMRLLAALEKKLKIRVQPKELHYGKICVPMLSEEE